MRRVDARIFKSPIVRAMLTFGDIQIAGAFFLDPREVVLPGGNVMGVATSFECQYTDDIATLSEGDELAVDDYGNFRFLRELQPGGDESGKTIIELGEIL